MNDSQPLEPADACEQLGRMKLGEKDLDGVLDRVAHLAKRTLAGAHEVSVTLVPGKATGPVSMPRTPPPRFRCRTWPPNPLAGLGGPGPAGRRRQFPVDRFADP
jgi:hypothetical protein